MCVSERQIQRQRDTQTEIETDRDIDEEIQKETKTERYELGPEMTGDRSIIPEGRKVPGSIHNRIGERECEPGVSRARWWLGWTGSEPVEERSPEDKCSKQSPGELEVRHGQGRGGTHAWIEQ